MEPLTAKEVEEIEKLALAQAEVDAEAIKGFFTVRELRLIRNCVEYAYDDPAGLPGHNLMVVVAKMANFHGWLSMSNWLDLIIDGMEANAGTD